MNYPNRALKLFLFSTQSSSFSRLMSKNKKPSSGKLEAAKNITDESEKAVFLNKSGEICLSIFAKPGAKDTEIADIQPDAINVRIAAPPVDGEANKELIKFISKMLNLRQSDVSLDKGSRNRNKVLVVSNCKMSLDEIMAKLRSEINHDRKSSFN